MNFFKRLFVQSIGVDLGTANTLIYVDGSGILLREPSVVAIDEESKTVLAVGEEARAMIGRTPNKIKATRPLKGGVIADYKCARVMLEQFLQRVARKTPLKPDIAIGVPAGVTGVERKAVRDAAYNAGAGVTYLPDEPMAAAIGAGLPVTEPTGSMIVDIGGGTTEIAVISLSNLVLSDSVRIAGDELNEAISQYLKKVHNLAVGERTAEEIKLRLGTVSSSVNSDKYDVRGLNLINGLPRTVTISRGEVREALLEPVTIIIDAIKDTLERTPPELAADIYSRGIVLAGGGALLQGLDELIMAAIEIPVFIAEDPLSCVALGTGKMLTDPTYKWVLEQSLSEA
jgi:rod shape-determining protein MreB